MKFRRLCAFLMLLAGCRTGGDVSDIPKTTSKAEPFRQGRLIMGTLVEITIFDPGDADPEAACTAAYEEIVRVDELMSTYKRSSELSTINAYAAEKQMPLTEPTNHVLGRALHWATETKGAFDPTVGPMVSFWRLRQKVQIAPTAADVRRVLSQTGYDKVSHIPHARRVRFTQKDMRLDFGGLAKGYAVDKAAESLKQAGIRRAIVNAGGDLYAFGAPSAAGIQHPLRAGELIGAIRLENRAVATSGNYERFFEIKGKHYCHIFDPRTGWPVQGVVSVTVTAFTALDADALATAAFVLGAEKGIEFLNRVDDVEGLIITKKKGQQMKFHQTTGFKMQR